MDEGVWNEERDAERNAKRCFVAVPAPPEVCRRAGEIQDLLRRSPKLRGIRWLNSDGLHITLKFLGRVPAEDVPYIIQQLDIVASGCWPCELSLDRLGVFPNLKRARIFWWGTDREAVPAEFRALYFHVEEALSLLGFEKEARPFHPHLTLGRMKENVDPVALAEGLRKPGPLSKAGFPVREFALMESRLHPQGATYETLAVLSMGDPEPAGEG